MSFHQDDINKGECLKSPDIMGREQAILLLVLLFVETRDSRLPIYVFFFFTPSLASFLVAHLTPSFLFCVKQTHTCAARAMAATSEGNVFGLYLEL